MTHRIASIGRDRRTGHSSIRLLRAVAATELREYKQGLAALLSFQDARTIVEVVVDNQQEVETTIGDLRDEVRKRDPDASIAAQLARHLNRVFANYLSSLRLYTDHTRTRLTRIYGRNSPQVQRFLAEQNKARQEIFAYRFMLKLRNYVQHCGMPYDVVKSTHALTDEDANSFSCHLLLGASRDELLSNYKEWGDLRKQIATLEDTIPLHKYMPDATATIRDIEYAVAESERIPLLQAGRRVVDLIREGFDENHHGAIIQCNGDLEDVASLKILRPPWSVLLKLGLVQRIDDATGPRVMPVDVA